MGEEGGVHGTIMVYFKRFYFSISVTTTIDSIVSRIGPIAPSLLLVDNFEPIRNTIKSSLAATGIEKI